MATNDVTRIAANFGSVEAGAAQIQQRAQQVVADLEDFHREVTTFVNNNGGGTIEQFKIFQDQWKEHVNQINITLKSAGQLVSTGNADLQGKDTSLANLFT